MNAKKLIPVTRRQSKIVTSKKNLWFYSESSDAGPTPISEKKTFENDWLSIVKQDNADTHDGESIKASRKKDCSFVVDWQMSDTF